MQEGTDGNNNVEEPSGTAIERDEGWQEGVIGAGEEHGMPISTGGDWRGSVRQGGEKVGQGNSESSYEDNHKPYTATLYIPNFSMKIIKR